jgi:hypothetical protein
VSKQAGLFTPQGMVDINETATKQAAVGRTTDLNQTVPAAVTTPVTFDVAGYAVSEW